MKKRKWLVWVLVLLLAVMIAPAVGKTVHAATKLTLKELKWTRFYSDDHKLSLYVLPSSNVKNYTFRIYKSTNKNDPSSMQTQAVYSVITSSNIARKETFGGDFEAYIKQNPDYYYQFSVTASPANSDYLTSDETYSTAILGQWLADGYYTGCELSKLKLKVTEYFGNKIGVGSTLLLSGDNNYLTNSSPDYTLNWQYSADGQEWVNYDNSSASNWYELYVGELFRNRYIRVRAAAKSHAYYMGESTTDPLWIGKSISTATPNAPTVSSNTSDHSVTLSNLKASHEYLIKIQSGGSAGWDTATLKTPSSDTSYSFTSGTVLRIQPSKDNCKVKLTGTALYNKTLEIWYRYKETDTSYAGVTKKTTFYNAVDEKTQALKINAALMSGTDGRVGAIYKLTYSPLPEGATDYVASDAWWELDFNENIYKPVELYTDAACTKSFNTYGSNVASILYLKLLNAADWVTVKARNRLADDRQVEGLLNMTVLYEDGRELLTEISVPAVSMAKVEAGHSMSFAYTAQPNANTDTLFAEPTYDVPSGYATPDIYDYFPSVEFNEDGTFTVDASHSVPGVYFYEVGTYDIPFDLKVKQSGNENEDVNSLQITVTEASDKPSKVAISPTSVKVLPGGTVTFTASSSSSEADESFAWFHSLYGGEFIGNGRTLTYTANGSAGDTITISVLCKGVKKTATISLVTEAQLPPKIITDASNKTVSIGDTVKIGIKVDGINLQYQWYYRNSSTDTWKASTSSSAKTSTFSFTAAESHSGHQYYCKITNSNGSTNSSISTVKVIPKITTQPVNASVAVDCAAKFTVAAKGTNLKYQWQYRNSSTDTWKNSTMACAKTATFTFTAAESHSGHQYRCGVSNANGTKYTDAATVTVRPLITTQPNTSVTVAVGGTVKLTTAAKGTNLKYQWQYRNSSSDTWKNSTMACAKTNTFTFTAAESHSGHQYRCNVSNGKGTTPTKTVTVTVTPKITTQPANASVAVDCTAKFTVAAKGTNLTYQWQYRNSSTDTWKNSTMACAKTAVFSFKVAESHSGHQYRCAVSNGKGTAYSNAATLTVRPLITTQPKDTTVSKGATVKLTVAAKGTNLTYQWQYRNSSTDTWKNSTMACAKTNTFTFTAAASHSGHQYRCAVSNGKGTTYTKTATLTVK